MLRYLSKILLTYAALVGAFVALYMIFSIFGLLAISVMKLITLISAGSFLAYWSWNVRRTAHKPSRKDAFTTIGLTVLFVAISFSTAEALKRWLIAQP